MDPYDNNAGAKSVRRALQDLSAAAQPFDPLETTINTAIERVECLKRIVEARNAVKRAQLVLAHEEAEAEKLGAYTILPANLRPQAVAS